MRFSHTIAGTLLFAMTACTAHYSIHPGALNQTDSVAYDALLIAQTTIDATRQAAQNEQLSADANAALKLLIGAYNVARESWLTYRRAISSNSPSQAYLEQLNRNLAELTNAIRNFTEVRK
jgi:hypothetical protein